jgi:branched-chain amino acid transport system ATP-binding protein
MTMLRVTEVVGGYGASEDILKAPSIGVAAGEIVTIIGPNGAGKSTLLKAIAGLVSLKAGRIEFDDVDVTREDALGRARAGISFVPQERNVFGALSVAENLSISAFLSPHQETRRRDGIYARYPMLHSKRHALARTLSGGQRKILAVAMGLMTGPHLILLDEPTAGLSPMAAEELLAAIVELNRSGLPILMVEQHALEALSISNRGYVLVAGRVHAEGTGEELSSDPSIRRLFLGG